MDSSCHDVPAKDYKVICSDRCKHWTICSSCSFSWERWSCRVAKQFHSIVIIITEAYTAATATATAAPASKGCCRSFVSNEAAATKSRHRCGVCNDATAAAAAANQVYCCFCTTSRFSSNNSGQYYLTQKVCAVL